MSTGFRIFTVIPIAIVLATLSGASAQLGTGAGSTTVVLGGAGACSSSKPLPGDDVPPSGPAGAGARRPRRRPRPPQR